MSTLQRRKRRCKKVILLKISDRGYWVYELKDVEKGLLYWGTPAFRNQPKALVLIAKALARTGLVRNLFNLPHMAFLVPLMGISERRLFPTCYIFESIVHCFDCWPPEYGRWEMLFRRHRIKVAFFSARQSAEHFRERLPQMKSYWLPEAVDPANYIAGTPLAMRSIDVLELGRAHVRYHDEVTPYLTRIGAVHLHSMEPGSMVFPAREELVRGLGNTKISVCFPSSTTHPRRSGNVETVTYRYFESMASKCLIVGKCPMELMEMFGYNPCLEVDFSKANEQLEETLRDIESFQPLVDRNYERLLEIATYEHRARTLLDVLAEQGYEVPIESDAPPPGLGSH